MSRLEKKILNIPDKVKVELQEGSVFVQGIKGNLSYAFSNLINIEIKDSQIKIKADLNKRRIRAQAGLTFALINTMIKGVTEGYTKELEIVGVGYRAQIQDKKLNLQLGFSHPVIFSLPEGIKIQTPKPTQIVLESIDKEKLGTVAAQIRAIHPPEPYKGKGIRYKGEYVRRKLGKAAAK